jgi:hypothetical protein
MQYDTRIRRKEEELMALQRRDPGEEVKRIDSQERDDHEWYPELFPEQTVCSFSVKDLGLELRGLCRDTRVYLPEMGRRRRL